MDHVRTDIKTQAPALDTRVHFVEPAVELVMIISFCSSFVDWTWRVMYDGIDNYICSDWVLFYSILTITSYQQYSSVHYVIPFFG